jgi:MSHA biogenesis protein MshI
MSISSIFSKARARAFATASSDAVLGVFSAAAGISSAVVQRRAGEKPRLVDCQAFVGAQAFTALSTWRRKRGHLSASANLLLDMGDYQILPIEMPELPASELSDAARWKVKDMIEFPAEEASVACLLVPAADPGAIGAGRQRQALAVVTPRSIVADWMARSRDAKLALHAIDIPELALRNIAGLVHGTTACGLLHVGLSRTTLVMVWQGELCSYRRFDVTASQLLDAGEDERNAVVERLALDLQRTSDAFERQFHTAVLGPMRVVEEIDGLPLAPLLSQYLSSRVVPFHVREHLDFANEQTQPLIDAAQGIDFIPAIGAALREEQTAEGAAA